MKEAIFLRACRRERTERTPIWMMRQAGRYLPEYRAIREKYDFLTMCRTPSIASEITIQPVEIIGVDAGIIFSDILVVPEAMGMKIHISEESGPWLENPVRTEADVDKLVIPDPADKLKYVLDAISITRRNLREDIPLIGFSGSPWTLFAYMVEGNGSKNFERARAFIYSQNILSHRLLEKISASVSNYLMAQIESGVNAIQIFDTWAALLGYEEWREFSLAYIKKVIDEIKSKFDEIPVILFARGMWTWIDDIIRTGCDVISIDWTFDIGMARRISGGRVAVQGNLDPAVLLSSEDIIVREAKKILDRFGKGDGHIFNLGHGILPDTPVENARILVEAVKRESVEYHK
jgi:uroporphyrinogen decarboxylase